MREARVSKVFNFEAVRSRLQADPAFRGVGGAVSGAALEALRKAFATSGDAFDRQRALAQQIGAATDARWRAVLMSARDEFEDRTLALAVDSVRRVSADSPEAGWRAWLAALADATCRFRLRHAAGLCEPTYAFDALHAAEAHALRCAVRCFLQSRWEERIDDVLWFAEQPSLTASARAGLLCLAGQIQLWRFENPAEARKLLDRALGLAPDDALAHATMGAYWSAEKHEAEAEAAYRRAIELDPSAAAGYVGLAELCERLEQMDQAEAWYAKALASAGGDALSYERCLTFYGRATQLRNRREAYAALMELRLAMDRDGHYDVWANAGAHHASAKLYEEARAFYEKAIALQPTWPRAYVGLAELRQALGDTAGAETLGRKAIDVEPECPEGYIYLGQTFQDQRRWEDALAVFRQFPTRPRAWAGYARSAAGRMEAELGRFDEACETLLRALEEHSESAHVVDALENFAVEAYEKRGDAVTALRVFDAILATRGQSYRATFHNLRGHLHYWRGDYAGAAAEYSEAVAAEPSQPGYHRNLGSAMQELGDADGANRAFRAAYDIDHDGARLSQKLAALANTQGNVAFSRGEFEAALEHYREAAKEVPGEAIYHSNMAHAWERLATDGTRAFALEEAVRCLEAALVRGPDAEYEEHLKRLRRLQEFVRRYGEGSADWTPPLTPVVVEVASDLVGLVRGTAPTTLSDAVASEIEAMRSRLSARFGIAVPGLRFRGNEGELSPGTYVLLLNEVPLVSGKLEKDRRFVVLDSASLAELGVVGVEATDPLSRRDGAWVDERDARELGEQGHETVKPLAFLMRGIEAALCKNLADLTGHQEVIGLLEAEGNPATTELIRRSPHVVSALTRVCKALLAEKVPISPFGPLIAAFKELHDAGGAEAEIVERVRSLPQWRERLPGKDGRHELLGLGERLEAWLKRSLYEDGGRRVLAATPEACQAALSAVREAAGTGPSALVSRDPTLRPFVRRLVELESADIPVLAAAELDSPTASIRTGAVELHDEPEAAEGVVQSPPGDTVAAPGGGAESGTDTGTAGRVILQVHPDLEVRVSEADGKTLEDLLAGVRETFFNELGLIVPRIEVQADAGLAGGRHRIVVEGVVVVEPSAADTIGPLQFVANDTPERLRLLGVTGRDIANPEGGERLSVVDEVPGVINRCRQAGLTTWGAQGFMALRLAAVLRRNAASLYCEVLAQHGLDVLADRFPDLARIALARYPLSCLTEIQRRMLDDLISIKDLRGILESLLAISGTTDIDDQRFLVLTPHAERLCFVPWARRGEALAAPQLADHVRSDLKRQLSHQFTRGRNALVVYLLSPALERRLARLNAEPLSNLEMERLHAAVRAEVDSLPRSAQRPVVLTTISVRRALRRLLAPIFPDLAVLCYQELSSGLNIQPIATIGWP